MTTTVIIDQIEKVALHRVVMNPHQPRKNFLEEEIEELAESIRSVGLLHPPTVRKINKGKNEGKKEEKKGEEQHEYELISGERRVRACQLLGWKTISVVVCESSQKLSAEAALIENVQRVDLNPVEVARGLKKLTQMYDDNQTAIAQRVGKKRSTVANFLRLLTLPKNIQTSLEKRLISMGHAKIILSLDRIEQRELLHQIILRDNLTVRESEEKIPQIVTKKGKQPPRTPSRTRNLHLEQLEEKMQQKFGTKVSIQGKGKRGKKEEKGRISIDYYSYDDLDRLLEIFGL